MRISGIEPSSVILSQIKEFKKLKRDAKMQKEAKAKRNGVINPQNCNFYQISTQKILVLSNATNQPNSTVELGYMCHRGLSRPPAVTLTK